jgi:site-specific DNA-methyltransferase (adenine-specific)
MQDFKDVAKKMKAEFGVGSLSFGQVSNAKTIPNTNVAIGRYPANIVLSHHDDCEDNCHDECPVKVMDEQSGKVGASRFFYISKASRTERDNGLNGFEKKNKGIYMFNGAICKDLKSNIHPTIKPVKLMRYLVKLVTPPNGKVLDPFCGSGTTGIACKLDGFQFVGIEQDKEYTAIADARVHNYTEK